MLISEKQIMQLICIANQLLIILSGSKNSESIKNMYNSINKLLDEIANQQSEKLIEVKDE